MEKGASVEMIVRDPNDGIRPESLLVPDKDETCMDQPIPLSQMDRLKQRATAVNQLSGVDKNEYQRCLVIHLDSRSQKEQLDVFFYHHQRSETGEKMAHTLRNILEQNYGKHQPRRSFSGTVTHRNLYMLRRTTPVTVFVELGNIRNFRDQQRFVVENNRQALANWLCEGIIEDYRDHLTRNNN
jgi:N-acetylmuramoyl-L-alanine amidase